MPQKSSTVCIVDDDSSVLLALDSLLRSLGLKVKTFQNPRQFLEYAKEGAASLVIVDVGMPELNGLEVQTILRSVDPRLPVIMMTGQYLPDTEKIALAQGAIAFLVKPFSDRALMQAMNKVLPS
jgi:two-component system response regulator FixJ